MEFSRECRVSCIPGLSGSRTVKEVGVAVGIGDEVGDGVMAVVAVTVGMPVGMGVGVARALLNILQAVA
jgi:hypothetical protein